MEAMGKVGCTVHTSELRVDSVFENPKTQIINSRRTPSEHKKRSRQLKHSLLASIGYSQVKEVVVDPGFLCR